MTEKPDSDQERLLKERGLAFFGAITASVSHELNNVISIIDQNAGLLADLLIGTRNGREIPPERLTKIAESISHQTERGVKIIKRLNRFAHSVDDPEREFDLNDTLENLMALTRRFANLKKVQLETRYAEPPITLVNSPFRIQQALFLCLRWFLSVGQPEDIISVTASRDERGVRIVVDGPLSEAIEPPDLDYLKLLMDRMSGAVRFRADAERHRFELLLPTTS
jgi:signal transduction histidine kinase